MYKCSKCGTIVDVKGYTESKCPSCRYRILFKQVPQVKRSLKSR